MTAGSPSDRGRQGRGRGGGKPFPRTRPSTAESSEQKTVILHQRSRDPLAGPPPTPSPRDHIPPPTPAPPPPHRPGSRRLSYYNRSRAGASERGGEDFLLRGRRVRGGSRVGKLFGKKRSKIFSPHPLLSVAGRASAFYRPFGY